MDEASTDPMKEIKAMQGVAGALDELDDQARRRVISWAADRYTGGVVKTGVARAGVESENEVDSGDEDSALEYESVAELYSAAAPQSDPDRALVAGYWLQICSGKDEFDAQSANKELKHLGHGVGNITQAFNSLKGRNPQLVMQTRKSGTSQQARKRYTLTLAGRSAVEAMLRPAGE